MRLPSQRRKHPTHSWPRAVLCVLVFGLVSTVAEGADDFQGFYTQPIPGGSISHSGAAAAPTPAFSAAGHRAQADVAVIATTFVPKVRPTVSTGGGQAGYNIRANDFVVGLELDLEEMKLNDPKTTNPQSSCCVATSVTVDHILKTDWLLTGRPRFGVVSGHCLVYGTAGAALTNRGYQTVLADTFATAHVGWVAGGGLQYQHAHVLLRGEYLYAAFGSALAPSPAYVPPAAFPSNVVNQTAKPQIVRGALNFRF